MRIFLVAVIIVFITVGLSAQNEKPTNRKPQSTAPIAPSSNTAEAKDRLAILQYAKANNLQIQPLGNTGLWYEILFSGFGAYLKDTTSIKIAFEIYDLNNQLINTSADSGKPRFEKASMLGPSFNNLIPKMRAKTKVALFVPSNNESFRNPEPIRMILTILEVGTPEAIEKEREEMMAEMAAQQKEADALLANEPANIQKYIKDNKLNGFKSTKEGVLYKILKPGRGAHPKLENTVKAHYRGTLLDGKQFDSSYDRGEPIEFPLTNVIRGWQIALPLLGKGGKAIFIIPSGLAYGPQSPSPDIPAHSPLVFEIELIDIK